MRFGRHVPWPGWLGPLGLGLFLLVQLGGEGPAGRAGLVWLALLASGLGLVVVALRRVTPTSVMAVEVLAAALVVDWVNSTSGALRDLELYLQAGREFLAGGAVYRQVPLSLADTSREAYPYLYPPPTLPFFGFLATLPYPIVAALWLGVSILAVVLLLRWLGLSWRWTLVAFLWPPIEQGIFVGNIVVPSAMLLALAPRAGSLLALGPLAKPQNGVLLLWLVRRRAWRALGRGLLLLVVISAATLPLAGPARWEQWVGGLLAYAESAGRRPGLYGIALDRWLPMAAFFGVAIGVTLLALMGSRRHLLQRLSLASVVTSPSLWSHGFIFAIPAFLDLPDPWFWLVAGLLCGGPAPGPQLALAITVGSWLVAGAAGRRIPQRPGGASIRRARPGRAPVTGTSA